MGVAKGYSEAAVVGGAAVVGVDEGAVVGDVGADDVGGVTAGGGASVSVGLHAQPVSARSAADITTPNRAFITFAYLSTVVTQHYEQRTNEPYTDAMLPTLTIKGRDRPIDSTLVMGVVNASPESFSDGGRHTSIDAQLAHASSLIESGADIIDVGGQSSVTNQQPVEEQRELERVLPIVQWLCSEFPQVLVSVDTYSPLVVSEVLHAGAHIINDVSGLRNPEVALRCAEHGAALVVMHTAAPPKVRLQDPALYADVTAEVVGFLRERMDVAVAAGMARDALIVDPGPDFTKTPHQTLEMLRHIDDVRALGRPLMLALSRKDFLGAITQRTPRQRGAATAAAIAHLVVKPGNIVRVHDVAAAVDVIATVDALMGRSDVPPDFVLPDSLRYEKPRG